MKISVVTPCHNAERWIVQSLKSAAAQTRAPYEILVINDCSTDGSDKAILSSGVAVRLMHADVRNAAAARNLAIAEATGDWIAFLDADDYWKPHHLERAAALLHGTGDVAYTALDDYEYEDGVVFEGRNRWPLEEPTSGLTHEDYIRCWLSNFKFAMNPTLVRRDRFLEVGGFDEEQIRRHDFEMFLRVIHGKTWTYNPEATVVYRADTPGSISRTNWASSEYYHLLALSKNAQRYEGTGFERIIAGSASRAVSSALTDGDRRDVEKALTLAWPYISPERRFIFSMARRVPSVFACINRARRARIQAGSRKP